MAFFKVGDIYRQRYLIESVVPFFQGELAIAVYEDNRYYLQSASLNRQAPLRAINQYRNLKLPQVIPYLDVFDEPDMLVFIRPYVEIRPLREVITSQELSEEQVVKWTRELLHVEAVLRSKPMSMYLLLDLRNVGVDSQNNLKVFFCGLEQIMVYESKLDWGTFIYSMLSGQFLDGPILKLPRNFKVSRSMSRLIQKSFKEYSVPAVLEQVEIFESKNTSGGILSKLWGDKKEENAELLVPNANQTKQDMYAVTGNRPIYRTDQISESAGNHQGNTSYSTVAVSDELEENDTDQHSVVIQERGSLVKEDDRKEQQKTEKTFQNDQSESSVTTVFKDDEQEVELIEIPVEELESNDWEIKHEDFLEDEPLVGAKDEPIVSSNKEERIVFQPHKSTEVEIVSESVIKTEKPHIEAATLDEIKLEEKPDKGKIEQEESSKEQTIEVLPEEKEVLKKEKRKTHPDVNQTTVKVSPALAQLEGQDLTQSFVLKLNKQQEELEKEQQERLKKMREEYERREQELIEQHRKKLEEEKFEKQQQELLKKKREELARLEKEAQLAKERKQKEERRKAKLAEARKQFEAKQKLVLEQEEKAFQERQEALLAQLLAEYEQRKTVLLKQQEEEYQARTKAQLAALTAEWEQVEAETNNDGMIQTQSETTTNQETEKPEPEPSLNEDPLPLWNEPKETFIPLDSGEVSLSGPEETSLPEEEAVSVETGPVTKEENDEIDHVFADVLPVKEPEKSVEKEKQISKKVDTTSKIQGQPVEDVFVESEKVDAPSEVPTITPKVETEDKNESDENEVTTDDTNESQEVASGEEAPKKKRRRRRRRRKKKTDGTEELSTQESATTTDNANTSTPSVDSMDEERRKRELELQQMERELLEMEQQEEQTKPNTQKKKTVEEPIKKTKPTPNPNKSNNTQPKPEPEPEPEPISKNQEKKEVVQEQTTQIPAVAKKPKVPVVKDTTEHATLAKQFEQYLKLFKKKK
jgi:hypothetical protein